jgi:mannose-6-phosphate isomerase-like protein (cupin superfamily)
MKFVAKKDRKEYKSGEFCTAYEYPLDDKDINGSFIEVSGRYPEKGRVANAVCKELAYIISGSGKIVIEEKEILLNEGDLVLVEPGEKYFWEGKMTMFVPCAPAWYPEQHKEVE